MSAVGDKHRGTIRSDFRLIRQTRTCGLDFCPEGA